MKNLLKFIAPALMLGTLSYAQTNTTDQANFVGPEQGIVVEANTANVFELQNRLSSLQQTIQLPYNQKVHGFVDFFIFRKPSYTKRMLERQMLYFPTFERYLAQHGLPNELKYLSVVESGLNPQARSKAKAVGLWQFMSFTGKEFGLSVDSFIDERMHIEKSTDAACRYLKQLYGMFGDWHLALAAYNTGPGNVRKAIRKAGGVNDFWAIYPYLHPETRSYVPQFIALTYTMNHANEHGIFAERFEEPIPSASIMLNDFFDLTTFSNLTGISLDDIQKLNPHIQKDVLPPSIKDFELKIPADKFVAFDTQRQMILDSAGRPRTAIFTNETVIVDGILYRNGIPQKDIVEDLVAQEKSQSSKKDVVAKRSSSKKITTPIANDVIEDLPISVNKKATEVTVKASKTLKKELENESDDRNDVIVEQKNKFEEVLKNNKVKIKKYTVAKGDNLFQISEKFKVDVYDLKRWNALQTDKIMLGQELKIHLDEIETTATVLATKNTEQMPQLPKTYVVQKGDTLWSIAQQYGGEVSIDKIKKLNNLTTNTLKAGQKIKLV